MLLLQFFYAHHVVRLLVVPSACVSKIPVSCNSRAYNRLSQQQLTQAQYGQDVVYSSVGVPTVACPGFSRRVVIDHIDHFSRMMSPTQDCPEQLRQSFPLIDVCEIMFPFPLVE